MKKKPVGNQIKINGELFDVIGVVKEKQSGMASGSDDVIIIPYTTAIRLVKDTRVRQYTVVGKSSDVTKQAKEKLSQFLMQKLESEDAFIALSQDEILKEVNRITGTMSMMLRRNCSNFVGGGWNWYYEYNAGFCY